MGNDILKRDALDERKMSQPAQLWIDESCLLLCAAICFCVNQYCPSESLLLLLEQLAFMQIVGICVITCLRAFPLVFHT